MQHRLNSCSVLFFTHEIPKHTNSTRRESSVYAYVRGERPKQVFLVNHGGNKQTGLSSGRRRDESMHGRWCRS